MKTIKKFTSAFLAVVFVLGAFAGIANGEAGTTDFKPNFTITAQAAILINTDSQQIIYEKNADSKMYPASLTKMMTAIVVAEHIKDLDGTTATAKQANFDDFVGIDSSNADIKTGETMTVNQLLHCLLMVSANEAANILADAVAGSQEKFVEMMNSKAKEIGATSTHYANPHGLYADDHYSTARDQSKILQYAWNNEIIKNIMGAPSYTIAKTNKHDKRDIYHTFGMMKADSKQYRSYIKGGKTGFEDLAGRCLASVASQNNTNYLCVTLNSKWKDGNGDSLSTNYAFVDSAKIYDWAFSSLKVIAAAVPSDAIGEVKIKASFQAKHALLYPKEDFFVVVPADQDSSAVETKFDIPDSVMAPVKSGDTVGTVEFSLNGSVVGSVELITGQDISRNFLLYGFELIKSVFTSPWVQLIFVVFLVALLFYIYLTIQVNKRRKRAKQAAGTAGRNTPQRNRSRTQAKRTTQTQRDRRKRR